MIKSQVINCKHCNIDFILTKNKRGKINECEDCAEETVDKLTGVMIYEHKTGCSIQINNNPELTKYIIQSTKLQCKGSNLGNNLKVSGKTKHDNGVRYLPSSNQNVKGNKL